MQYYHIYYKGMEINEIVLPGKSTLSYFVNFYETIKSDNYIGEIYLHNVTGTVDNGLLGKRLTIS